MNECGFRIERGRWFLGPCRLEAGHDQQHSPYAPGERDRLFEERFGFPPTVTINVPPPPATREEHHAIRVRDHRVWHVLHRMFKKSAGRESAE